MLELKAKVGTRGQVVIPKPIRDILQIHVGEDVYFRLANGEIMVRKGAGEEVLKRLLEIVPKKKPEPESIDWDEMYYSQFSK